MIRDDEMTKVKVLIKAYLLCHPGKHTAGEISSFINSGKFGIVHGVTATEIGIIIKRYANTNSFMNEIQSETKFKSGGRRVYFI